MIIGYARVSSREQNLDRQLHELKKFGCEKIFTEKESGKSFKERTVYNEMRNKLRFHDVLVVHDLSRFGRNKEEILAEWKWLTDNEIDIVVLNMPILDTRKYSEIEGVGKLIADIVLSVLSWVVEDERRRIRTAQREGIEIAKTKGRYTGRPLKYHANAKGKDRVIFDKITEMLAAGESVLDISKQVGVSRNTIYSIRDRIGQT